MKVSVAVISYNSSSTITETLDSILRQDYGSNNIELIISDDASTDSAIECIEKWLKTNKGHFYKVSTIYSKVNNGISMNCNTAWKNCTCEWVKTIGADDILEPICLSSNIDYIRENSSCSIVFSFMKWFGNINKITPSAYELNFFELDNISQYKYLKYFSFNMAPSSFIKCNLLKEVGYADEKYRFFEDLPLWLRITKSGVRLHFNKNITVRYRISESISKSKSKFINQVFINDCLLMIYEYKKESFPSIGFFLKNEEILLLKSKVMLSLILGNKKTFIHKILFTFIWLFTPVHTFYILRKKILNLKRAF